MSSVVVAGDTSGSVTISAPAVSGSSVLTLPAVTDTLVGLAATQTLTNKSIAATQLTGTVAAARLPAGSVLQVVSTTKTDTFSSSTLSAFTDITSFSVSITPSSSANKVLVFFSVEAGGSTAADGSAVRLVRDSTAICVGDTYSLRIRGTTSIQTFYSNTNNSTRTLARQFLDSPATTSSVTYKVQFFNTGGTWYVNRQGEYNDNTGVTTGASTITVMEIQG